MGLYICYGFFIVNQKRAKKKSPISCTLLKKDEEDFNKKAQKIRVVFLSLVCYAIYPFSA